MANKSSVKTCARCGGETAAGTMKAGKENTTIVIAGEADGFLGVIPYTTSQVGARICKTCGVIELYAKDVRDLLRVDNEADEL